MSQPVDRTVGDSVPNRAPARDRRIMGTGKTGRNSGKKKWCPSERWPGFKTVSLPNNHRRLVWIGRANNGGSGTPVSRNSVRSPTHHDQGRKIRRDKSESVRHWMPTTACFRIFGENRLKQDVCWPITNRGKSKDYLEFATDTDLIDASRPACDDVLCEARPSFQGGDRQPAPVCN